MHLDTVHVFDLGLISLSSIIIQYITSNKHFHKYPCLETPLASLVSLKVSFKQLALIMNRCSNSFELIYSCENLYYDDDDYYYLYYDC